MTDQRQRRIDTLGQAARRKSEAKTKAAETAIRSMIKRGELGRGVRVVTRGDHGGGPARPGRAPGTAH